MFLDTFLQGALGWTIVLSVLTAFELLNARDKQSVRGRASGVAYWIALVASAAGISCFFASALRYLHVSPIATLPIAKATAWAGIVSVPLAVLAGAMFQDFVFYWYHRAQHRWFWRWHAVHHSVEEMSAVNSYHHISEGIFSLILVQIPTTLILADTGPAVPFVELILWLHVVWIHSPTRFHLGPFRILFADNRFHRIHHSLEQRHFDKNFGAFTTLWDRMFGTCHMPAASEWPAVGLAEVRQPTTMLEWWTLPARYKAATQPPITVKNTAILSGSGRAGQPQSGW